MSLNTGVGKLTLALKALEARWEQTRDRWRDPVSQSFEEDQYMPLKTQVLETLREIERLSHALDRARQSCG